MQYRIIVRDGKPVIEESLKTDPSRKRGFFLIDVSEDAADECVIEIAKDGKIAIWAEEKNKKPWSRGGVCA